METTKQSLTFDDLPKAVNKLILEVSELKSQLQKPKVAEKENEEFFTYEETMKKLNISRTTLWLYGKQGKVTPLGKGKRRFYSKKDIISFMEDNIKK